MHAIKSYTELSEVMIPIMQDIFQHKLQYSNQAMFSIEKTWLDFYLLDCLILAIFLATANLPFNQHSNLMHIN